MSQHRRGPRVRRSSGRTPARLREGERTTRELGNAFRRHIIDQRSKTPHSEWRRGGQNELWLEHQDVRFQGLAKNKLLDLTRANVNERTCSTTHTGKIEEVVPVAACDEQEQVEARTLGYSEVAGCHAPEQIG